MSTRRAVLDAALELIASEGHGALSFREVARRAGVSHQAPYHHFGDRQGILAAIAEEGFRGLTEQMAPLASLPALERLEASGIAYVRWALAHPGHYRTMFRPDLVPLDTTPGLQQAARRSYRTLEETVEAVQAAGYAKWHDTAVLVSTVFATVHGTVSLTLDGPLPPPGRDAERLADAVVRTLTGLVGRDQA